jgi:hypothetical protein
MAAENSAAFQTNRKASQGEGDNHLEKMSPSKKPEAWATA